MSDIIGENTVGSFTGSDNAGGYGHKNAAFLYTAVAGDTVQELFWHGGSTRGNQTLKMAIYTVVGGNPNFRASAIVTVTVSGSSKIWYSGSLSSPFSLTAGTVYTICFGFTSGFYHTSFHIALTSTSKHDFGGDLPILWIHSSNVGRRYANYAIVTHAISDRKPGIIGDGLRSPID